MRNYISVIYCILSMSALVTAVKYPHPDCYKKTARSGSCLDKYAAMPGHLNCRSTLPGETDAASGEAEIVHIHNQLRASVIPNAGNMMELEYTHGLQHTAQRWTSLCSTQSSWFERTTPGAFIAGQNTYRSPANVPWKDVLNVWIAENASFTYNGSANNKDRVGNYTQMISGPTTAMGCAVSDCHGYFLYMCLYVPILNPANIRTPYKESKLPNCNTTSTLCNCQGVICLGGSTLNLITCACECIKTMRDPRMYNGTVCELTCNDPHGDDPKCGGPPYTNDSCDTNMETMFHCPYMCNACPYARRSYSNGDELLPWEKGLPNCTTANSTTQLPTPPSKTAAKAGFGKYSLSNTTRKTTATGKTVTGSLHHKNNSASRGMHGGALLIYLALMFVFKWM